MTHSCHSSVLFPIDGRLGSKRGPMPIAQGIAATRLRLFSCLVSLACLLSAATVRSQFDRHLDGRRGDGNWTTAANWSLGIVPMNSGTATYNVIIPQNAGSILFNAPVAAEQVTDFSLAAGSTLTIPGGRDLAVLQDFSSTGTIQGSGGLSLLSVPGPGIASLDFGQYYVSGGATLSFPAVTSYSWAQRYDGNIALLSADGTGSLLNLSHVANFNGGAMDTATSPMTSRPTNNGLVDLSGVTNITGAAPPWSGVTNWLQFSAASGGSVNLSSLDSVSGRTQFTVGSSGKILLGQVVTNDTTSLSVTDPTGNLAFTTLSMGSNSSLSVAPGATVTMYGSLFFSQSTASLVDLDMPN